MRDFSEFRRHWRPLAASFIGMGSALSLNSYILSTFAPYFIKEFGWSRSQWALLGTVQILVVICLPLAGRLTDLYGVRRVAAIGALSFPVFLVAIATMKGDIRVYLAIYILQTIICSTTTATTYARVVVEVFKIRRGLALAIAGSSPPLVGAMLSPLVTAFVGGHGWRGGYLAVAAFSAVCAVVTLALLPRDAKQVAAERTVAESRPIGVYREIAGMPVFWMILAATFLVNMPFALATSQLKMVVLEQGVSDGTAALLVSAFAIGSIVGRLISGAALDYLSAHVIAAIGFGIPCIGLLMLASGYDATPVVAVAILLIGMSFGSEGDVLPFLVVRYFGIGIFSTTMGLMSAAIGLAMALGNVILGIALAATDSFNLYLLIAAAASLGGSAIFLMLGLPRFRSLAQPA